MLDDAVSGDERPLWTCPSCGHRFVTANVWHSCTSFEVDAALAGLPSEVLAAWTRFVEMIAACGPITVIAQKSRIVIMSRVRFAGVVLRRRKLIASFALTREVPDARFRIERYSERWIAHRFDLTSPADLEIPRLAELLCESYRDLGMQGAPFRTRRPPFEAAPEPGSRSVE